VSAIDGLSVRPDAELVYPQTRASARLSSRQKRAQKTFSSPTPSMKQHERPTTRSWRRKLFQTPSPRRSDPTSHPMPSPRSNSPRKIGKGMRRGCSRGGSQSLILARRRRRRSRRCPSLPASPGSHRVSIRTGADMQLHLPHLGEDERFAYVSTRADERGYAELFADLLEASA